MSQSPPAFSETPLDVCSPNQSKTLFATKDNPYMILVTLTGANYQDEQFWFPHPLTALAWCLENGAGFVFVPVAPDITGN